MLNRATALLIVERLRPSTIYSQLALVASDARGTRSETAAGTAATLVTMSMVMKEGGVTVAPTRQGLSRTMVLDTPPS